MGDCYADFSYLKWKDAFNEEKPYELFINLPQHLKHLPRTNLEFEQVEDRWIRDARGSQDKFTLDIHGFEWQNHTTKALDLRDRESITSQYLPEVEQLLRAQFPDAEKVHVFDWRLRKNIGQEAFSKRTVDLMDGMDALLPATHPHIDQSPMGAINRCRLHLPNEADRLLQQRFRIVNVWRPLHRVDDWPLAVCDARSVDSKTLVAADIVRRSHTGESWFGTYSPEHMWYYLSNQEPDEILLLKIYDSDTEVKAKYCMHCAFARKSACTNKARESIEVRAMIFS